MPIKLNEREYRDMTIAVEEIESRADDIESEETEDRKIVEGYATTFDDPYVLYETDDFVFIESVSRNAFDNTDMSDVIMQYDHAGRVFARMSNNTLEAIPDDFGLHIRADLSGTEIGRNLFEEIRGGYTNKMSFGFTISAETWDDSETDESGRMIIRRTIDGVGKLYDVSAVSIPANDGTSISATNMSVRSLVDGVIDKIEKERFEREQLDLKRRKVEMKIKTMKGV